MHNELHDSKFHKNAGVPWQWQSERIPILSQFSTYWNAEGLAQELGQLSIKSSEANDNNPSMVISRVPVLLIRLA
jgi:hypothetical protein